jgi:hypothetical protein
METIFFGQDFAMRLQAGAVGSLIAVLTTTVDPKISPYKRMFCGWIVAVFGAPLAVSICMSIPVSTKWLDKVSKVDLEMVSAFFTGLIGWRVLGLINLRVENFVRNQEDD